MVIGFIFSNRSLSKFFIPFLILLIFVLAIENIEADTRYIANNGNDNNPGTQDLPWKTVEHAGQTINPGDTVIIEDGISSRRFL